MTMRIMTMDGNLARQCLVMFPLIVLLSACSVTGSGVVSGDTSSGVGGGYGENSAAASGANDKGVVVFSHLPVPCGLEKVASDTVVFTTTEFHGGIFTLKGGLSKEAVMEFFKRRLPQEGWLLAGLLDSETCYMAFKNATGGACLIQISSSSMGLSTEVRIFVSEGTGGEHVFR